VENSRPHETASTSVNVTVGRRSREYLTEREVERLIEAAKQNRSGHRDATAILVAYRHGLRASEVVALLMLVCVVWAIGLKKTYAKILAFEIGRPITGL
jgi:integrase